MGDDKIVSIQSVSEKPKSDFPFMNPPTDGWDGIANIKAFPDLSRWVVCPYCGKKAIRVLPETKIHKMPYKCRGSKCKKEFLVNVE